MNRPNASNTGKGFEALLSKIFAAYEDRGIATFSKVEPPVRIIGGGPNRKIIPLRNPFLDFSGVFAANGGRAIHIEAKSTAEPRLPVGCESGGVTLNQINNAIRWKRAGAAVGVLWLHDATVKLVTTEMLMLERDRKSIRWEEAIPIPQGPGFIIYDFLRLLWRADNGTVPYYENRNTNAPL